MAIKEIPTPVLPEWVKLLNTYDPEHYTPGKRVSAEEWNTLFLASVNQGNYNSNTLELLINNYLPKHFDDYDKRLLDTTAVATEAHQFSESAVAFSNTANATSMQALEHSQNALEAATKAEQDSIEASQNSQIALQNSVQAVDISELAMTYAEEAAQKAELSESNTATALEDARDARTKASEALSLASAAEAGSTTALQRATSANTKATTALENSNTAVTNAASALTKSEQASTTANAASLRSEDAIATANAAKMESASAKSVADSSKSVAEAANNLSTDAQALATTALSTAQTASATAQDALDQVKYKLGTRVTVGGEWVETFNADAKASVEYVDQQIATLIGAAPEILDTFEEVAAAFKENEEVVNALNSAIGTKADRTALNNYLPLQGGTLTGALYASKLYQGEDPVATIKDVDTAFDNVKDINVNEFEKEFTDGYSETELSNNFTWAQVTSPSGFNARQRSCCYGNGYYVIAGTSGQIAYSKDAVTWTNATKFSSAVVTGLAYGNGYFLAVDSNGYIYRTDSPENVWQPVYQAPLIIESIRYVNNKYYAVGEQGFIAYSFDGYKWTRAAVNTTKTFIDIGYGAGKYVAVGHAGTVFTSINGLVWYDNTIPNYTTDIRAIMYANGQFVIGSSAGRIDYSKDGINWTQANNPSSLTINWIRNFTYHNNRLYAVMYASTGQGEIWLSKDKGTTWSVAFTPTGTSRLWCVCSGNNKFFASGDNGYIFTLDMNLNWQDKPTDGEHQWYRFKISQNDGSVVYSDAYYNSAGNIDLSGYYTKNETDSFLEDKANKDEYLSLNGGTLKGMLYTEASTPYFIGKNKKVGMRAVDENNKVVGQFFVSDSDKEAYNGYYSGFVAQGNDGKNYAIRISANGPVYRFNSEDHPMALKEEIPSIDGLATKDELNDYLPLNGGTMTGPLLFNNTGTQIQTSKELIIQTGGGQQYVLTNTEFRPTSGYVDTLNIGKSDRRFKDGYFSGTVTAATMSAETVNADKVNVDTEFIIQAAGDQQYVFTDTEFRPTSKSINTLNIGRNDRPFHDAFFEGTIYQGGKPVANKEDIPDVSNLASKSEIPDSYTKTEVDTLLENVNMSAYLPLSASNNHPLTGPLYVKQAASSSDAKAKTAGIAFSDYTHIASTSTDMYVQAYSTLALIMQNEPKLYAEPERLRPAADEGYSLGTDSRRFKNVYATNIYKGSTNATVATVGDIDAKLISYYKKTDVDTMLANKADTSAIPDISNLATKAEIPTDYVKTSGYQDISGTKNFASVLQYNGAEVAKASLANVTTTEDNFNTTNLGTADPIIKRYVSSDGQTWVTVHKSGWKEMGGVVYVGVNSGAYVTVTLPEQFGNNRYTLVTSLYLDDKDGVLRHVWSSYAKTKTSFSFYANSAKNMYVNWYACGAYNNI